MSINKFICTGNLTKDPQLRELPSGGSVCELRVAVDGMGRGLAPGFINVSTYGRPGQRAAQLLRKGSQVAVEARLEFSEWEDKQGVRRHDYTAVGQVLFLSGPATQASDQATPASEPIADREPQAA